MKKFKPIKVDDRVGPVSAQTSALIYDALAATNGKASSFTISAPITVIETAARAEAYLVAHNVSESDRNGAVATLRPSGPSANAYGNSAISTEITLKRAGGVWSLVAVDRVKIYPRNPERFRVTISDRAAANLVKRSLGAFGRTELPVAA